MPSNSKVVVGAVLVLLVVLGLAFAGGFFKKSSGTGGSSTVTLTGSGSSFIAPQMYAWANQMKEKNLGVIVEYESVGSGAGVANFLQKVRDFGASDPPLPHDVWVKNEGKVIQMPVILGAVVVVYNIPGINGSLNLTGEVVAKIYAGQIEYWDDPQITSLNPGVKLPHKQIIAVHRSDGSGTTEVFTTFLHKSAPDVWGEDKVGKTVEWPVDSTGRGVGAKGNEGVTETLKSTPYSIGYIEWSYALDSKLPMAALQNANGDFVLPTKEGIQKAASHLPLPDSPLGDFSQVVDAVVYSDTPGAYPVASFSFLLFWTDNPAGKVDALKELIRYINNEGQDPGNIVKGYVPIPVELRQFNLKALDYIKAEG